MAYRGTAGTGPRMFAAAGANIFDVTAGGAVGAAVQTGLTSAQWDHVNFTGAVVAAQILVLANGVDAVRHWNGSTWVVWALGTPGTGIVSGVAPTKLKGVVTHQRRLWFIETGTSKVWYTPIESAGGALGFIDPGPYFPRGGNTAAMASWSVDGGLGVENLFVAVSENGDAAIFVGSDPSDSTKWQLKTTFQLAPPVGRKCFKQEGGDLFYLCRDGMVNFSSYLQNATVTTTLTDSIRTTITAITSTRSNLFGFQMHPIHDKNLIVLNVPAQDPLNNMQFVFNTQTKAWSSFNGWNAECWETFGNATYFGGSDGVVYKAFTGYADKKLLDGTGGTTYKARAQAAFNYFDIDSPKSRAQRKQFVNAKVSVVSAAADPAVRIGIAVTPGIATSISTAATAAGSTAGAVWDEAIWNEALWSAELFSFDGWQAINGVGNCASILVEITSQAETLWMSTWFRFIPASGAGV